ncbi:MAG TPA: SpoVR family protein [Burkholderiales bacterium]|nr:SpoVR family protein [Burkholderiales bacterium]
MQSSKTGVTELARYAAQIEALAKRQGLDYYDVDFELAPESLMTEIAVYGLPIRMPHWSFGVRYIHQLVRQSMGHSKIFEVMFPGDPCRAFLMDSNSLAENALVTAHVIGHADFSKNNQLFARFHEMAGGNIVEHAAAHAHRIQQAIDSAGMERVESVLDAALSLESHVDVRGELHRARYPEFYPDRKPARESDFAKRFRGLPGEAAPAKLDLGPIRSPIPPHPEYDLLWFIAQYAPDLEQWERDIFLMVRSESLYFYPVFACQIMNEGWASYWHARLLREADFLPQPLYLAAIKAHSDVVRPFASGEQTALAINPYHLGFTMWETIVEKHGLERAREVMREEDDFGFVRNWLDRELAEKSGLFVFEAKASDEIRVASRDLDAVREAILAPKFNYGAPRVAAVEMKTDGSLTLKHDHASDGRGLDVARGKKVLEYVRRVWRRPVRLVTVNERTEQVELAA